MSKDYQVKIAVRNGRLVKRMRAQGIESIAELARRAEVCYQTLVHLYQMKNTPLDRNGDWRPYVLKVAGALGCLPGELFNEQQLAEPLETTSGEMFMDDEQVSALIGGGGIETIEAKMMIDRMLASPAISHRESRCLRQRFLENMTLQEIGEEWGFSRDRIRQIEEKALRKLRTANIPKRKLPRLAQISTAGWDRVAKPRQ